MEEINFSLNGEKVYLRVDRRWTLLFTLREVLKLKGTKCGCSTGDCGSCKVLLDGIAVNSCTILVKNVCNKNVVTIEGIAPAPNLLHPIQQAFIEVGAVQCGFCTPGMIVTAKSLLDRSPRPSEKEIREALEGNLCRCTGYVKIVEAIQRAAEKLAEGGINFV